MDTTAIGTIAAVTMATGTIATDSIAIGRERPSYMVASACRITAGGIEYVS